MRELKNWERITVRDPERGLKFVARDIPPRMAERIRSELSAINGHDPGMVHALFDTCREFLGGHKIFDDVLYRSSNVRITEEDVDEAHADVADLPNLAALLNAGLEELQEDEIEG